MGTQTRWRIALRIYRGSKTLAVGAMALAGGVPGCCGTVDFSNADIPIPTGLVPGDQFQLVFVTSNTTTAVSTDINYYNAFVNSDANTVAGSLVAGLGIP